MSQTQDNPGGKASWNNASWEGRREAQPGQAALPARDSALTRFLGGSPAGVFVRLFFMSLIVGALLIWLDVNPWQIFHALERFVQRIWHMGFDAIREIASYVIAGAVIVVPIWLLLRLMNMRGR